MEVRKDTHPAHRESGSVLLLRAAPEPREPPWLGAQSEGRGPSPWPEQMLEWIGTGDGADKQARSGLPAGSTAVRLEGADEWQPEQLRVSAVGTQLVLPEDGFNSRGRARYQEAFPPQVRAAEPSRSCEVRRAGLQIPAATHCLPLPLLSLGFPPTSGTAVTVSSRGPPGTGRVKPEFNTAQDALGALVPPLLLQPRAGPRAGGVGSWTVAGTQPQGGRGARAPEMEDEEEGRFHHCRTGSTS